MEELISIVEEIKKKINSLIIYLDKSEYRGQKLKGRDDKKNNP